MPRNAILSFANGYRLSVVEPFLASWARYARSAELVLFTDSDDDAFHEAARRLGVRLVEPVMVRDYPLLVGRHFVYRDFLREHGDDFDNVLLTDSRDVVFQGDPFAVPRDAAVTFAAEDERIRGCWFNGYWLHMVYGGEVRAGMADEIICCAGTTIGTRAGISRYLDLMCHEADRRSTDCGDQAYHNFIAYVLRPDFIGVDQDDWIAQTLNHTAPDRLGFVDGVLLVDGVSAPVVHQYDRHVAFADLIRARHRLEHLSG